MSRCAWARLENATTTREVAGRSVPRRVVLLVLSLVVPMEPKLKHIV